MVNHPNRSRRIAVEFTPKELELLWLALGNGAGDDAIFNLGLTPAERKKLGEACNRIADAGNLKGPRF